MKTVPGTICGIRTEILESAYNWICALAEMPRHEKTPSGIQYLNYSRAFHPHSCGCSECYKIREADRLHNVYRKEMGLPC